MSGVLHSHDPELRDLANTQPRLIEAYSGRPTGVRLVRCLGTGGMSTVFLGELDPNGRSMDIVETAPRRLAIKFLQVGTYEHFLRFNLDPANVFLREVVALSRMMDRTPPTEFVVSFYGSGHTDVQVGRGQTHRLPWLAIEQVEGGPDGVSLTERVERAPGQGVDPVRALRLLRGIFTGVEALHAEGIIHRDLKPDNVLVAGPVDDETPKLADCGIARVDGLSATIAGMTPAYGGPEQVLSVAGVSNPLVGPWTDVHALAAIVWYVLGGTDWCRSETDPDWHAGIRRSLRTAPRVHPAFVSDAALLAELDAALGRGGAARLPALAWQRPGAPEYMKIAERYAPGMATGPERFASVGDFMSLLLPIVERASAQWANRAAVESRAATAYRPTKLIRASNSEVEERVRVEELPARDLGACAKPDNVVFQPDGRILARFGDRLFYFVGDDWRRVSVPEELQESVAASRWLTRGPGGGFALVGAAEVILIRGGRFSRMTQLPRAEGREVGDIQSVIGDGRTFGVLTEETDDSNGGPELWRSADGAGWDAPVVLPLGGDVHSIAYGPYGYLVVGSRRQKKARALFLGFDNQPVVYVVGVNDRSPLRASVCSAGREAWAAGEGYVLCFDRTAVRDEPLDSSEPPIAMGLDLVGAPWLLTSHRIFRRHATTGSAKWRIYHERDAARPSFIGFGFTPDGVRLVDETGSSVQITPQDIDLWRSRASETIANTA